MRKYIRIILTLLLAVVVMPVEAQNGINSPYSQYGVGFSNMPYNAPIAASMGGVVYTRSYNNMINPFNPASYAAINKETFVFDMGLSIDMSTLRDNTGSQFDADGQLGHLNVAFPLTNWWKTSLGVMPLSDVNYQSTQTSAINPGGEVKTIYEGTGGVAQLFWGHGFNILGGTDPAKAHLRAGFNLNFMYGSLTRAMTYDFVASDTTYFMDSRRQKDTYIKNLASDLGLQYDQPLGEHYSFGVGVNIRPHRTMTVRDNALVYTFVTNAATEFMRDTVFPTSGNSSEFESTLEQPFTTGIGLSFQHNDLWLIAVDATFMPWNGLKYTEGSSVSIFGDSPLRYGGSQRYAVGLQLLGDRNSSSYLRRITFSAGAHYEAGRMQMAHVDGTEYKLDEWGVGLGCSLPMRKGRSVLNISASYSSFGTVDLLRRDLFSIGISVGSCESWFVKRKFN